VHDDVDALRDEVARLRAALESERRHAEQWRVLAEERRVAVERLRQHPVVRLLVPLANLLLPRVRDVRRRAAVHARRGKRAVGRLRTVRHRVGAGAREQALKREVAALSPAARTDQGVTAVVLTRDGRANLERLLPALREEAAGCPLEILVVDNGSGADTVEWLMAQPDLVVVRTGANLSFSAANNLGARSASHGLVCFLNDDVAPVAPGWLPRLVEALSGDVIGAGAQLVYPRQPLLTGHSRDISVQHAGIDLFLDEATGIIARNRRASTTVSTQDRPYEVFAVTAACFLVDARAFWEVGGFDERYVYGSEDVDLCWGLRLAGKRVVVVPGAVLYHHEGATRHQADPAALSSRQAANRLALLKKHGPSLRRALWEDRVQGPGLLSPVPFRVAITLTRDLESAGYGDYYTAHELGDALTEVLGWQVRYVERYRDAWYDHVEGIDAVVVLLDGFDVRRLPAGVVTVAWIRNWVDRWLSSPWFDELDVVLTSSAKLASVVRERSRHSPIVFPLATNPDRFTMGESERVGTVFTGNYWGKQRLPQILSRLPDLAVYGKGWDAVPETAGAWRGHAEYSHLPGIYARARFVLDQAAGPTWNEASVNSRIFDALAAGALPVTDQAEGAVELFGDLLPLHIGDLASVQEALSMPETDRRQLVQRLRQVVLEQHTYQRRARQLADVLVEHGRRTRIAVVTGIPDGGQARTWGDWHFAEGFARALVRAGAGATVHTSTAVDVARAHLADALVYLHGRGALPVGEGQLTVLWCISHPEDLSTEECDEADLVLVASHTGYAEDLAHRTRTPVRRLLQATDHRRFYPRPVSPQYAHPVAFVGNSRFVHRQVVRDAFAAGLAPAVYGANWSRFLPSAAVLAEHVPNEELPELYSSVSVLLNDHWESMRTYGIASNRMFDALACGGVVVSDHVPGIEELFNGAVATYRDADDLRASVERLLTDHAERRDRSRRGREAVVARHTFDHRAAELVRLLRQLPARASATAVTRMRFPSSFDAS
jgi:GT2 family glycosyltransferase/spore maturation protein CgeB